jgi:hypothetical protein
MHSHKEFTITTTRLVHTTKIDLKNKHIVSTNPTIRRAITGTTKEHTK